MSKIILFNMVSLDGFFAGLDGNIDWHHTDEEFNAFSIEQLAGAGGLIFGRVTYELMAEFWPSPDGIEAEPETAALMNSLPKIVVSRTLEKVDWNHTKLFKGDQVKEIVQLKKRPGKDWFIFGSADLAATFFAEDLIDEIRVIVNPVILCRGIPLFKDATCPLELNLLGTRKFNNGNVLHRYEPRRKM